MRTGILLLALLFVIAQSAPVTNCDTVSDQTVTAQTVTAPIVISGYVSYAKGAPAWNPNVTVTNLLTSENFAVTRSATSNYYQIRTIVANLTKGDRIRFDVSDGTYHNETVHEITADDLEEGVVLQNLLLESEMPDLIITDCSVNCPVNASQEDKTVNITYTVANIGDSGAGASNTTIYIDGVPASDDPVGPLAPGETHTSTVGPIDFPHNSLLILVCADNKSAVNETGEMNNCAETELNCSLPNLCITAYDSDHPLWEWVDEANGRYNISYRVTNWWCGAEASAGASKTTINITTFASDGSASSVIKEDSVPALPLEGEHRRMSGPFTCSGNHTVIEVCTDGDKKILETNEDDNCLKSDVFFCPASASMPDLTVVTDRTVSWVDPVNETFEVTYTVANIGSANASASTTRVNGTSDPVPELAPGENYSGTVGPFLLSGTTTTIGICADYHDVIAESNEANNCWNYSLEVADLQIWFVSGDWIDGQNRTYSITYKVCNYGDARSNVSEVSVFIDGNLSKVVTDHREVLPGGRNCIDNTTGPFTMTGDSDRIGLRMTWEQGSSSDPREHEFWYGGCLADDGVLFKCGDHVTRSCTFTGDMRCARRYSGTYPNGLLIGADDIVIDGNGSAIIGEGCDVHYCFDSRWIGISNRLPGDTHPGYKNVTVKNLEVRDFHIGVSIANADYNTLTNCSVHDNGDTDKYNYGITAENSDHTTIDNCSVYNNTGTFTHAKESAGHGINFHDDCNHCNVTNSSIVYNHLSGIYASPTCKYLGIRNNLIEDNGYCGRSGFCTGINLHWRGGYGQVTNSTVLGNTILNNTGPGIYVTQGYTVIADNLVCGSRNGTENGTDVIGNGILIDNGKVTFLYNNTACDNEGTDIANKGFATFGDDNTCDTTDGYDDEGTVGCIFYCGGANGVCVGKNYNFSCGMVVNESCRWNRSISCRGCGGDGLIAGADDITIDGCGYTITGNFTDVGIFSNHTNVTIKNLQAKDFSTGIGIGNTTDNTITNCNLRKNQLVGINFSADNGTLCDNRIYDNNGSGIVVGGDYNTLLNNIAALNNGYGIYFSPYTENNTITTNAIGDNVGIDIYDSQTNIGDNNTCDTTHHYWDTSMTGTKYGCTYPWTPPDLIISRKWEDWVDKSNKTYNVTYTLKNIGKPNSREAGPSTTFLYVDRHHVGGADDRVGSLSADESKTETFDYTAGMSDDEDEIWVCADGDDEVTENNRANKFYCNEIGCYTVEGLFCDKEQNNCKENTFEEAEEDITLNEGAACVADDGSGDAYRCGDLVTKSCTFNGSMSCPAGDHGLNIERGGITIDGNEFALIGPGNASCANFGGSDPSAGDCGIYNSGWSDVTITNLEIVGFCNGIGVKDAERNAIIDHCTIHGNGNPDDGRSHGIHIAGVRKSRISNNVIYENAGADDDCEAGGNGIFMYECSDNTIEKNTIYKNRKGGIFMKMGPMRNTISDNDVYENGQGGIVLRCIRSNDNTIENNDVLRNYGDGIYIRGDGNTVRNNRISDNTAGFTISSGDVVGDGDGIDMSSSDGACRNEAYGNEVCGNAGGDIKSAEGRENSGDNNYCDTTENYHDAGCTGCTYPCEARSKPDLVIAEGSEAWKNQTTGMYEITYVVKNIGNVDAPVSETRIWIDGKSRDYSVPALNVSESNASTVSQSGTSGEIDVYADGKGTVDEGREDNNRLTLYALPDLIVTEIDVPEELSIGLNSATATIRNIGTAYTEEPFEVALFVNDNPDPEDTAEVSSSLSIDGSDEVTLEWTPVFESNKLKVVADYGDAIWELDEEHNEEIVWVGEGDPNGTFAGVVPGAPGANGGGDGLTPYIEVDPSEEMLGGGTDFDETIGNGSESALAAKKRVSAFPFASDPFFGKFTEVVVSYSGITVAIALSLLLLFYVGFRGELTAHRRNNR